MIYNLILQKRIESFATVKITGIIKVGHAIKYKHLTYKVVDIDGVDIIVSV